MTAGAPLTTADTCIHITRSTPRWDHRPATAADALDFWSFAAGAANVVMQLCWPGVGYGMVESKVESGSLMKRFLTVGFLAPVFREALQVEWTAGQQRRFEYLFRMEAFVNRFLPKFIRQGGGRVLLADVRSRIHRRRNLI